MAMIDYGAVAFKNGKLISTGMFTPMEQTCGFSDRGRRLPAAPEQLDGNFFVIVGNQTALVAFYKESFTWWQDYGSDAAAGMRYAFGTELLRCSNYAKWSLWHSDMSTVKETFDISVKPRNGYYTARIRIGDDRFKVYFGYGVDYRFYKKTRRINYYRSPEFFVKRLWRMVKSS